MITFQEKGSFNNTERYLKRLKTQDLKAKLNQWGQTGTAALAAATPTDTGETAASWYYTVVWRPGYYSIRWRNRHIESGTSIAVILQYGHATRNGGWVEGRDYIMPAIRPIFDQITTEAWKEVTRV